jgi:hypothetical protein
MTESVPGPGTPSIPAPRAPGGPAGHLSGRSADGRPWELLTDAAGIVARTPTGTVAEAHVSERDEQVVLEFWADETELPHELSAELVRQAFTHPAVQTNRPVLVCVPRRNGGVIADARRHVQGARTRAAGVTCLMEGRVQDDPVASDRPATPVQPGTTGEG